MEEEINDLKMQVGALTNALQLVLIEVIKASPNSQELRRNLRLRTTALLGPQGANLPPHEIATLQLLSEWINHWEIA